MTAEQFTWYAKGYYRALIAALRAIDHVLRRRALWMRQRQQDARRAARERAALGDLARAGAGEQLGPLSGDLPDRLVQPGDQVHWNFEHVVELRDFIPTGETKRASLDVGVDAPPESGEHRGEVHSPTLHPAITGLQSGAATEGISKRDGAPTVASVALPGGELARRQESRRTRKNPKKNTRKL